MNYLVKGTVYSYTLPSSIQGVIHPGFNYFNLGVPKSTTYVYVVVSANINNYYGTPIVTDEKELVF
ncbi:hypothetical protein [Saccharolobus caldissimus]|uniref:Uncharacterized protein n=1 Tax=Saccharolobus caldissimus TaxID=1702097 RepID=A0AAQ4CVG5_9CREN|nr:hypothetical protein [Saccharolobus caldissimus]BDB99796.1 hypothetical protein SACC_28130 [Saccharolobus caldissimus]